MSCLRDMKGVVAMGLACLSVVVAADGATVVDRQLAADNQAREDGSIIPGQPLGDLAYLRNKATIDGFAGVNVTTSRRRSTMPQPGLKTLPSAIRTIRYVRKLCFGRGESYRMDKDFPRAFRYYNRCRWVYPELEAAKYARGRLALPEMLDQFERDADLDDE